MKAIDSPPNLVPSSDPLSHFPAVALAAAGPVSGVFIAAGAKDLRASAEMVWRLPYGRNARPDNELCVLHEGRGTCSTKHALLARLLAEQQVEGLDLYLGIYAMSEANTPGVGGVLEAHGLRAIPEAHCFLVAGDEFVDLTRTAGTGSEPVGGFFVTERIEPGQIGEYKRAMHRAFMTDAAGTGEYGAYSADELWRIREECIAALAE